MKAATTGKVPIFIAGGAGFIGSQVAKALFEAGYETLVFDDLSRGHRQNVLHGHFVQGSLAEKAPLKELFERYRFAAVFHFASLIDVGESVLLPEKYYRHNVTYTLNLLEVMLECGTQNFIFSSSAAIFGNPSEHTPIDEEHPQHPINPYGRSKLQVEQILTDITQAHGLQYSCLRYFNAAGGDPAGAIKYQPRQECNLIPLALEAIEKQKTLTVYGTDYHTRDGSCVRDYIHIADLANAHILAMERLLDGAPSANYNLGNGAGFTVKEVLSTAQQVTKKPLQIALGERRPGDPDQLVADATKAQRELHWQPLYSSLETIIGHAWQARQK